MKEPSKYKSITAKELKARPTSPLTPIEKTKVNIVLNKLIELIKVKHT